MSFTATFHNLALSTSFNPDLELSSLSLNWVVTSGVAASPSLARGLLSLPCGDGSFRSMNAKLAVMSSLPSDLDSGYVHIYPPTLCLSEHSAMDVDEDLPQLATPFSCVCHDASSAVHGHAPTCPTSSLNILRDIFTAHYRTHSRISVFHLNLPTIKTALALQTVPHHDMSLSQCRQALIHHLVSGACVEHKSDVHLHSKLDRSTCAVIAEEFESPTSMTAAILELILATDVKKITTEHLCHVAAALDITPSVRRNLRFKLRAAMRSYLETCQSTSVESRSSASVAEFFNSFEAHCRPILMFIAALHRIQLPPKCNVKVIRKLITGHILSGRCIQFSPSHLPSSPPDCLLPDCADVCNEWEANNVDKLTILDPGYGVAWAPRVPTLPVNAGSSTPRSKRSRERDSTVDNAFDNLSPSKRSRSA
ncbi:hypothetical protein B0H19DRAFT_1245492 [Mycena capillaripes]|nr:hypothetical protein B0H19DRAFT_1245492 [Mycena capillaripes]